MIITVSIIIYTKYIDKNNLWRLFGKTKKKIKKVLAHREVPEINEKLTLFRSDKNNETKITDIFHEITTYRTCLISRPI